MGFVLSPQDERAALTPAGTAEIPFAFDHDPAAPRALADLGRVDLMATAPRGSGKPLFRNTMLSGYWNGGAGCSIETLAELIGDTPKVAFDHYGREWGQHYQEPTSSIVINP